MAAATGMRPARASTSPRSDVGAKTGKAPRQNQQKVTQYLPFRAADRSAADALLRAPAAAHIGGVSYPFRLRNQWGERSRSRADGAAVRTCESGFAGAATARCLAFRTLM